MNKADALQSLLVCLGDDHRSGIEKSKVLTLCAALGVNNEEAMEYWGELLDFCQVRDTTSAFIDKEDLARMYDLNPEYNPESVKTKASKELLALLKELFTLIDVNGDGYTSPQEFIYGAWKESFHEVVGAGKACEEAKSIMELDAETLSSVFHAADVEKSGALDFVAFCSAVLKIDKTSLACLPQTVEMTEAEKEEEEGEEETTRWLDPSRTSPAEFTQQLKNIAMNHRAVKHEFLVRFSNGDFDDMDQTICTFLSEYRHYGEKFVCFMKQLMDESTNGHHKAHLKEDLEDENGNLSEESRRALQAAGIDPDPIDGVAHKDLFRRLLRQIHEVLGKELPGLECQENGAGLRFARDVSIILENSSHAARAAGMGIATESLVPTIYRFIIEGLEKNKRLQPSDYVFFPLHTVCDEGHGATLESIVADLALRPLDRVEMLATVQAMLDARCRLWDRLLLAASKQGTAATPASIETSTSSHNNSNQMTPSKDPEKLYNGQSQNWSRKKPNCLSDFTARPYVFEHCRPHITQETHVLDLGCGEGYCTRALRDMEPASIVGIDISEKMIQLAKECEKRDPKSSHKSNLHYYTANATSTLQILSKNFLDMDILNPEAVQGHFGLVTAVFLFNYMDIAEMNDIMGQVYSLLLPGGHFVFTVPHPALKYWDRESKAPFYLNKEGAKGYFKDRDRRITGVIETKDGNKLNIQSMHKTFTDYVRALRSFGFSIEVMEELGVNDELIKDDPAFFGGVDGVPLHVLFKVVKPRKTVERRTSSSLSSSSVLDDTRHSFYASLTSPDSDQDQDQDPLDHSTTAISDAGDEFLCPPREILWHLLDQNESFVLNMPAAVVCELVEGAKHCLDMGIDHTNYNAESVWKLTEVKRFAHECANRLMRKHGTIIVQGLDIDSLGETEQERERLAKLCYLILMTCVGQIDETRGRLFDVKDRNLDACQDNVLFSASSQECGWHTDGSSKDWFPDIVNLLCIRPSKEGGNLQISNTCNVWHELCTRLPKFLIFELLRPTTRDIIEKGAASGFGAAAVANDPSSFWTSLSRQPRILEQRIRMNTFPIYERNRETNQSKFRNLDHWLYSGHKKAGFLVSPLLKLALLELNRSLSNQCRFNRPLRRGEIAMTNNHLVAHRREAFHDPPDAPEEQRRLMVRCWLKISSSSSSRQEEGASTSSSGKLRFAKI